MSPIPFLAAAVLALLMTIAPAQSLDELQKGFMAKYDTLNAERDQKLENLDAGYKTALKRLLEEIQKSGKLETVLLVRDELTVIETGKDPLPDLPANSPERLRPLRTKFVDQRSKIGQDHARDLVALTDKMQSLLAEKETALTKEGRIDDALSAKRMRETLVVDAGIKDARDLLKYAVSKGNARPALQLRRFGDNLEVLVFPDRRGKISMDSPIQNVREKSVESKELGDTKAKVLGEFVGAKGYQVDPYVSVHCMFDGKDAGKMTLDGKDGGIFLNHLVPKFRHEEAGQKGLLLSITPEATSPYLFLGQKILPPKNLGLYRISCKYYIPESNTAAVGLLVTQGSGGHIIGRMSEKKGHWSLGTIQTESSNEHESLLLIFMRAEGKTINDLKNDYVVLGELKVEQLSFPAYILQKFGDHGETSFNSDDPQKQTLLISNGEFIQK